eukprot:CAMPEP_0201479230 /NCGR_PEP_ID=MMETSP0151_2-20130828/3935_1 /ASSEMBLY_ACC=CAM_ASM_000257 /TAXON_ID=200890 /ORGANISM="Paramoeba atlantica, Strain 621/1 / CCAP 1560/9" /LENGTH=185 /DNA_ID=CAMNT_0047860609 /DNA_START=521 /DNA_END=1078 /DNA_ORIENTATION=-
MVLFQKILEFESNITFVVKEVNGSGKGCIDGAVGFVEDIAVGKKERWPWAKEMDLQKKKNNHHSDISVEKDTTTRLVFPILRQSITETGGSGSRMGGSVDDFFLEDDYKGLLGSVIAITWEEEIAGTEVEEGRYPSMKIHRSLAGVGSGHRCFVKGEGKRMIQVATQRGFLFVKGETAEEFHPLR